MSPNDQSTYSSLKINGLTQKDPEVYNKFMELVDETAALNRFLLIKDNVITEDVLDDENLFVMKCLDRYYALKQMINDYKEMLKRKLDGDNVNYE